MKVEYKRIKEQSDYADGCLEITATSKIEAFKLGEMFQEMRDQQIETVSYLNDIDIVSIRIPLKFRED